MSVCCGRNVLPGWSAAAASCSRFARFRKLDDVVLDFLFELVMVHGTSGMISLQDQRDSGCTGRDRDGEHQRERLSWSDTLTLPCIFEPTESIVEDEILRCICLKATTVNEGTP